MHQQEMVKICQNRTLHLIAIEIANLLGAQRRFLVQNKGQLATTDFSQNLDFNLIPSLQGYQFVLSKIMYIDVLIPNGIGVIAV